MKNLIFVYLLLLTIIGCSDGKELLTNNDPSKYQLEENVVWASPAGFDLTLDIYSPVSNRGSYPVLVIFHGGGWLINDNSIMDQMSQYLATNSEYVICNVNYRLLSDQDNSVTLDEIVEDAFGAVIWIKHNISKYKGDNSRIAVTGDSAGAHLSAMIVNSGTNLSSDEEFRNNLSFTPTYLPNGKTAEQASKENVLNVQAAILSYGAFDVYKAGVEGLESLKNPFWLFSRSKARGVFGKEYSPINNPAMYKALSPIYNIPEREEKILPPQLLLVGSEDGLTTPLSVKEYATKLESFGQETEYWEYANRNHAFLDSGSNLFLGSSFEKDAPQALDKMIDFLDTVFKL
ncbi:MAG: alpha/beta hydrolase [SAR86 cluster bacterium]|jgi:acetyl esterase/lipase|nr:alpha/beta hydrolase [SAR86 cluster bacterium]